MKVRLAEGLQLIVTPENYVEHVALAKWAETHQGAGCLLVEAYAEHRLHADVATAVHKEWCIGGEKSPCNCGAEQIRNAGEA